MKTDLLLPAREAQRVGYFNIDKTSYYKIIGSWEAFRGCLSINTSIIVWIPIIQIRWSHNGIIFTIGILIPARMVFILKQITAINTVRPRGNGRHFPDHIFKCIFFNENVLISIKISLKFVPKGQIHNIPALVQTMAWRRPGDKPLSEATMVSLLTHICVSRPQWIKVSVSNVTFVFTMPVSVLELNGAGPSAGTMLTTEFDVNFQILLTLSKDFKLYFYQQTIFKMRYNRPSNWLWNLHNGVLYVFKQYANY